MPAARPAIIAVFDFGGGAGAPVPPVPGVVDEADGGFDVTSLALAALLGRTVVATTPSLFVIVFVTTDSGLSDAVIVDVAKTVRVEVSHLVFVAPSVVRSFVSCCRVVVDVLIDVVVSMVDVIVNAMGTVSSSRLTIARAAIVCVTV